MITGDTRLMRYQSCYAPEVLHTGPDLLMCPFHAIGISLSTVPYEEHYIGSFHDASHSFCVTSMSYLVLDDNVMAVLSPLWPSEFSFGCTNHLYFAFPSTLLTIICKQHSTRDFCVSNIWIHVASCIWNNQFMYRAMYYNKRYITKHILPTMSYHLLLYIYSKAIRWWEGYWC